MQRLIPIAFASTLLVFADAATAQNESAPYNAGKALVDKDCVGCHAQRFGGDPDRMYLRPDRRVKTPAQLLAQVQACNTNLGKGYFPEEEEHIAMYLNLEFYKFAP
jgi:mono/diheme cytochrome c family protein